MILNTDVQRFFLMEREMWHMPTLIFESCVEVLVMDLKFELYTCSFNLINILKI